MKTNVKRLSDAMVMADKDGKGLVSLEPRHFVVLEDITLQDLQGILRRFRVDACKFLEGVFNKTPLELKEWTGGDKYDLDRSLIPDNSPVGLKIMSMEAQKLSWLDHSTIVKAAIELGEIKPECVGSNGMRMKKGTGRFHEIMWKKSLKRQRALISQAFNPASKDIAELTKKIQQGSSFDFDALEKVLEKAKEPAAFLEIVAATFLRDHDKGNRGTNFAVCWFAFYLAKEGIWFFPQLGKRRLRNLTPRLLWRFIWDFAVPEKVRSLAAKMYIDNERQNEASWLNSAHCEFLLRTNLYHLNDGIDKFIFYTLKENETASLYSTNNKDHRFMGLNLFFDRMLNAVGKTRSEYEELSIYFGGFGRINRSKAPFSWMQSGNKEKPRTGNLREVVLARWEFSCPAHVSRWVDELEDVVRLSPRRTKTAIVQALNNWVYYLLTLDQADCPTSFQEIDRLRHIYNPNEEVVTFIQFIGQLSIDQQEKAIRALQQAWWLLARSQGFEREKTCPIDADDIPRAYADQRNRGAGFRTNKKSLGASRLQLLIDENRRADEEGRPFAFARSFCGKGKRPIYYRNVQNQETGQREQVFFPAAPIYLDVLFTTGMRSHSGRWLDSGEGDEYWIDRDTQTEMPNPLSTARKGRQEGFLRLHEVESGNCVTGMYIPVAKTGAHAVPWIDEQTAEYVEMMRDWQIKYNPQSKAILAVDDNIDKTFGKNGDHPEVFPLFRDPKSKNVKAPTYGALADYFTALLRHCEPIYNEKKRERLGESHDWESFFQNDSPRWTLHALRVTLISTLIEAGVPPHILQLLVGHKSLVMTYHYVAIDNAITSRHIQNGMERLRQEVIDSMLGCESVEEAERVIDGKLGGIVTALESGHCGAELYLAAFEERSNKDFPVFSHGICPGGDCNTGGEVTGKKAKPVFRHQACSRCRYRITGPAFLNGLVLRLNQLMLEIYESFERTRRLEDSRLDAQDAGKEDRKIEAKISKHLEFQEELFAEWAAELNTIQKCRAIIEKSEGSQRLPVVAGLEGVELSASLSEGHKLTLLQSILSDAESIQGVELEVPEHLWTQRNEMLLAIAEANGAGDFFYKLPKNEREQALNEFGRIFIEHQDLIGDEGAEIIDAMLAGDVRGQSKVAELLGGMRTASEHSKPATLKLLISGES
ncbi:MAG: VPA1269 family protein [Rhodospirillales bacterium]